MNQDNITRGGIFMADLYPIRGSEQGGYRPVVIIQNDVGNKHSPTVIVAAITSRIATKRTLPTHVSINDIEMLEQPLVILLEQIRTLDKARLVEFMGHIEKVKMDEIDRALLTSLGIKKL